MTDETMPPVDDGGGGTKETSTGNNDWSCGPKKSEKLFKNDVALQFCCVKAEKDEETNGIGQKVKNLVLKIQEVVGTDKVWCCNKDGRELSACGFPNVNDKEAVKKHLGYDVNSNRKKNVHVDMKFESTVSFSAIKGSVFPHLQTNGLCLNNVCFSSSAEEVTKVGDLCGIHPPTLQRDDCSKDLSFKLNSMLERMPEDKHEEIFTKTGRDVPKTKPKPEVKAMTHSPSIAIDRTTTTATCLKIATPKRISFVVKALAQLHFANGHAKFSPASLHCDDNVEGAAFCRDLHAEQNDFLSSILVIRLGGICKNAMTEWQDEEHDNMTLKTKLLLLKDVLNIETTNQTHLFGKWFAIVKKTGFKEVATWIDNVLAEEHGKIPDEDKTTFNNCPKPRRITVAANDQNYLQQIRPKQMTTERRVQLAAPPGNAWRNGPPPSAKSHPINHMNRADSFELLKVAKEAAEEFCKNFAEDVEQPQEEQEEQEKKLARLETKADKVDNELAQLSSSVRKLDNDLASAFQTMMQQFGQLRQEINQPRHQGPPCSTPGHVGYHPMQPTNMQCPPHSTPPAPFTQPPCVPSPTPFIPATNQTAITNQTQPSTASQPFTPSMEERHPEIPLGKRGLEEVARTPAPTIASEKQAALDETSRQLFLRQKCDQTPVPGEGHHKTQTNEERQEQQSPHPLLTPTISNRHITQHNKITQNCTPFSDTKKQQRHKQKKQNNAIRCTTITPETECNHAMKTQPDSMDKTQMAQG